jgi:sugar phosphate isomerase/epimerase
MLAGQRPGMRPTLCPIPFEDRIRLAGAVGYAGIGVTEAELARALARHGDRDLRALLADNGIRHIQIQALRRWWEDDGEWRRSLETMLDCGNRVGAGLVEVIGDFSAAFIPVGLLSDRFQAVARMSKQAGMVAALEIAAYSSIRSIGMAIDILGESAGSTAGLLLDSWHCKRLGIDAAAIAALPKGIVAAVAVADCSPDALDDVVTEALDHRLIPGTGTADIPAFLAALCVTDYDGPIGVEVLSAALRSERLEDALRSCAEATRAMLTSRH